MEKIVWTDRVKNGVLQRLIEEGNIVPIVKGRNEGGKKGRKANWIGHIWRRNCLIKYVIEGNIGGSIEVMRRTGRRRKQLLNNLKQNSRYCKLKKRKHYISLYAELTLEESMDLS